MPSVYCPALKMRPPNCVETRSAPPFVALAESWSTEDVISAAAQRRERRWLRTLLNAMIAGLWMLILSFFSFIVVLQSTYVNARWPSLSALIGLGTGGAL